MPRRARPEMSVDDLNFYIQGLFTSDLTLKALLVSGEIAEFKRHTSGHCYFTLLGAETRLSCALFKRDAEILPQWPRDGDGVLVEGSVGAYPPRGVYQLYARRIIPVGEGATGRARQELRQRLEAEGLFHPALKRPLPPYPEHAAVITSATGAALRDVLRIASRRYPLCEITVIPALVQGAGAPDSIVRALVRAGKFERLDCVLLVRGGGSREDLVPFDDERVARAVRSCPWPVVSGVGHEIDETLCDLAADVRASTPSAAAELVFPDRRVLLSQLRGANRVLRERMAHRVRDLHGRLGMELEGLRRAMGRRIADARGQLAVRAASLNALSPLAALSRGFVTAEAEGRRVLSVKGLQVGEGLTVRFQDGRADCQVRALKRKRKKRS
ncbi:MAG: exodeoxyribonuclease VII large subunit [Fretibacterium sp.]|nr:exodeoxyribonuclease VII large subunit [Fretibacterium sp.]